MEEKECKIKVAKIARLLFKNKLTSATGGNICFKDNELYYVTPHDMGKVCYMK